MNNEGEFLESFNSRLDSNKPSNYVVQKPGEQKSAKELRCTEVITNERRFVSPFNYMILSEMWDAISSCCTELKHSYSISTGVFCRLSGIIMHLHKQKSKLNNDIGNWKRLTSKEGSSFIDT